MPKIQSPQSFAAKFPSTDVNCVYPHQVACEYRAEYICWFDNGCMLTAAHGRRTFMVLTDIKVRTAKSQEKKYTLVDGDGMLLLIHPNGSKY